jgi:hypothetical protein
MRHMRGLSASTSLVELHFLHCKIDPSKLAQILTLPKALKRLTIEESSFLPPDDPNDYIGAMKHQWNTLESLLLIRNEPAETRQIRLQCMSKLSYLEIQAQVIFVGLDLRPPYRPSVSVSLVPPPFQFILPPNLEELVLIIQNALFWSLSMLFEILEGLFNDKLLKGNVPALKRVTLVFSIESLEVPSSVYAAAQSAKVDLFTMVEDPKQLGDQESQNFKDLSNGYGF